MLLHQHRLVPHAPPARPADRAYRLAAHVEQPRRAIDRMHDVQRVAKRLVVPVAHAQGADLEPDDSCHG